MTFLRLAHLVSSRVEFRLWTGRGWWEFVGLAPV